MENLALTACVVGFISAVSLPMGSALGLWTRPGAKVTSAFMAFGGGALLFALTIEIVAHSFEKVGFGPLALGCVIGGLLYEFLNHGLNKQGAFVRKASTIVRQATKWQKERAQVIMKYLFGVSFLHSIDPEEVAKLVPHVDEIAVEQGAFVFKEGMRADALYLIASGAVEIIVGDQPISRLGPGDAFGEMGLLTDNPRVASAMALEKTSLFRVSKEDFDGLVAASPKVKKAVEAMMQQRSKDLVKKSFLQADTAKDWEKRASTYLNSHDLAPTSLDINKTVQQHGGATLGIWLGILLDGIPESLVIGIEVTADKALPWALVAGVFLSNLPEAMSSSVVMRNQRFSVAKIILMWTSITVMTAVGALAGNLFFQGHSEYFIAVLRGTAAGAMLTMIAETMLPEAYEQGGVIVGLSTLAGFLAALYVKSIS
ncbi:MAG: cyclic nucleotide-binding domain-containing protein [Candidatus Glassbacteria bacterium]|nr:cyclic nucleotide-binding domain-containing protein [Candidatus Glassbacteria bacterium]